jgi:hypothetical protein
MRTLSATENAGSTGSLRSVVCTCTLAISACMSVRWVKTSVSCARPTSPATRAQATSNSMLNLASSPLTGRVAQHAGLGIANGHIHALHVWAAAHGLP